MISPLKTTQKTFLIIHLSLVFTALVWHLFAPFTQNIIQKKELRNTYLELIGDPLTIDLVPIDMQPHQQLQNKNFQREWQKLPSWEAQEIHSIMSTIEDQNATNFFESAKLRVYQWLFEAPLYEKGLLLLMLLIPFLVLLQYEGAKQTLILLPIITLIYIDGVLTLDAPPPSHYEKLFPTEDTIVEQYLKRPLSKDIFTQKQELAEGWHLYLQDTYPTDSPEFYFTKEKFYALVQDSIEKEDTESHIPIWALLGYFVFSISLCISLREDKRPKPLLSTSG